MKVLASLVLALVLVSATFVALVGAMLATHPWMAGRAALEAQDWTPRVGSVASVAAPLDQWLLITAAAQGSSCGVTAQDLAAIAKTESDFGRNMATNATGHFGYGQFDTATWAAFGSGDPYKPADALAAIARTLCGRGYADNRAVALNRFGGCSTPACLGSTDYASRITQLGSSYQFAGSDVVAIVQGWLGVPYQFGGCTRSGIDCSCLMVQVFAAVGIHLPRTAAEQYTAVPHIPNDQAQSGDVVFFHDTYQPGISHVWAVHRRRAADQRAHTGPGGERPAGVQWLLGRAPDGLRACAALWTRRPGMTICELVGDALKRLVAAGIVVLLLFGAVALLVGVCGLATALSGHG